MLIDFDKSDRFVTTNKNLHDGYIPDVKLPGF